MTEKDIVTQGELTVETVPDLPALAAAINAEHAAVGEALRTGLSRAVRAGELLTQAKALVGHGEWLPWLAANCATISQRTAEAYMRVARFYPKLAAGKTATPVADLSFREAVRLLAAPAKTSRLEAPKHFSPSTRFIPAPGCMLVGRQAHNTAWIVPSSVNEGYFYVTALWADEPNGTGFVEGLKKPVRQDAIEHSLKVLRFPVEDATWESSEEPGEDYNSFLYDSHDDYVQRAILGRAPEKGEKKA